MASWVLSRSASTLQCLTVAAVNSLSRLAVDHPNIRSLRVLGDICPAEAGLKNFVRLERLEVRAPDAERSLLHVLPESINYLRFWSGDLAAGLGDFLQTPDWCHTLPHLRTIAWDYWSAEDGADDKTLRRLQEACKDEGIELKAHPRTGSGGARATKVRSR